MSDLTVKLVTWYFSNKASIDALKDDQYVLELEERVKDIVKVGRYVWDNPEVQKLVKSLKAEFPLNDKPLFTADTKGPNPLNAKGDVR